MSTIRLTAKQYLQLGEDPPGTRLELVDGTIVVSPGQTPRHSHAVTQLACILGTYAEQHDIGNVFPHLDVTLGMYDVRRPDLQFFQKSRRHLIKPYRLLGHPDLAVEVVSESSAKIDCIDKFAQYAESGIEHYWIIDPAEKTFEAFVVKRGKYVLLAKGAGGETVRAEPFPELDLALQKLWWPR